MMNNNLIKEKLAVDIHGLIYLLINRDSFI